MPAVRVLRVWVVSICDVLSCEVLKEFHKYVGCVLKSERGELFRQKFDGKQCMIDLSILLWSWCRTCVFLSHSPRLSRFSPSVSTQSPVKVDVISPLLCTRNVSSSVVCSLFLDEWHSHRKVRWSNHSSGSSSSLPNIIEHRVSPNRSLKNRCPPMFLGGYGPLIHCSVRRVIPYHSFVLF